MSKHFVKNISFENFKCFKELKYDGFKRVNLIGGKNNIGKTSFMEGLNLALSSNDIIELNYNIYKILMRRKEKQYFEIDFIYSSGDNFNITINNNHKVKLHYIFDYKKLSEKIVKTIRNDISYDYQNIFELEVNKNKGYFPIKYGGYFISRDYSRIRDLRLAETVTNINFVYSSALDENKIALFYGKISNLNKEEFIDEYLQKFDKDITKFKLVTVSSDKLVLKLQIKNIETPILLSSLGDGINRYLAILCAIWASKDGYLFIDEIENGIHYTNYSKLWEIIFLISKEANCQIFATTHSKECISAFNKQNSSNEGLYLEFYRNKKTNLINIKGRDNKLLEYSLNNNGEFRGE